MANIELLILELEWMFSRCPGCCERVVIAVLLTLSRNEVAELSEAELIHLIRIQWWNPGSRSVDPKVHELDGRSGMKYSAMIRGPVCYRREVWRSPEKVVQELICLIYFQLSLEVYTQGSMNQTGFHRIRYVWESRPGRMGFVIPIGENIWRDQRSK